MRIFILIALVVMAVLMKASADCAVSDSSKVDCGFVGITQGDCQSKGCCWAESSASGTPWCFQQAGAGSCYGYQAGLKQPFSSSELSTMRGYFMSNINIQGKGGIVAAPDYDTPGGSYYFHWMRDAALTMRCLQETNPGSFGDIEGTLKSYVSWVLHNQNEADPNGQDVRTEPKFNLPNGDVFSGAWCRPQNDGPGLRATALIMLADSLLSMGETDYVKQYLWTNSANSYHGGAIKFDLDYVANGGWQTTTCDLWEEVRDADFFWNRFTMRKAMIVGAVFADKMGDTNSANLYRQTLAQINATLYSSHYQGGYVRESASRTRDSAVIVGFNVGFDSSDNMFAPTSEEVANTVNSYNLMFCNEYSINRAASLGAASPVQEGMRHREENGVLATQGGEGMRYREGLSSAVQTATALPGVLYGRYGGDNYAGGNPWVLSTAALAGLFYRGAKYVLDHGVPSASALKVWQTAFNSPTALPTSPAALAQIFAAQGDGVMLRLRQYVSAKNWHLDEQIDRNTGVQCSAEDLTWSYAEVLNAMHNRDLYAKQAGL